MKCPTLVTLTLGTWTREMSPKHLALKTNVACVQEKHRAIGNEDSALKRAPMWTQLSQDPGRVKAEVCEVPRPCGKDIDLLTLR